MIIGTSGLIIMALFFLIHVNNRLHILDWFKPGLKKPSGYQRAAGTYPTYKDTLPFVFLGRWVGTTRVGLSNVDDVDRGETVRGAVRFFHRRNGLTGMMIEQPGWQLVNHSIVRLNQREVVITRTSKFIAEAIQGTMTAVSRDHYRVLGPNRMFCVSKVQLYENGKAEGFYRTRTELVRSAMAADVS